MHCGFCLTKTPFVYTNTLSEITVKQKELLFAMAKEGKTSEITSGDFIRKYELKSASSVQSALKGLLSRKIVVKENGFYVISDRLFRMWLATT